MACVEVLQRVTPPDSVTEGDMLVVSDTEGDTETDGEPDWLLLKICDGVDSPEAVGDTLGVGP